VGKSVSDQEMADSIKRLKVSLIQNPEADDKLKAGLKTESRHREIRDPDPDVKVTIISIFSHFFAS
jgi:hypothetical protein